MTFDDINWDSLSVMKQITVPVWAVIVVCFLAIKGLFK